MAVEMTTSFSRIPQEEFYKQVDVFGTRAAEYLQSPVDDEQTLGDITHRASNFRVHGRPLAISVDREKTFDLGGTSPNTSVVAAVINMKESELLLEYLDSELSCKLGPTKTSAAFVVAKELVVPQSRRMNMPTFLVDAFVLVFHIDEHNVATVNTLHRGGIQTFFAGDCKNPRPSAKPQDIAQFLPPPSQQFMGLYQRVAVIKDSRWMSCPYDSRLAYKSQYYGNIYESVRPDFHSVASYDAPAGVSPRYVYSAESSEGQSGVQVPGVSWSAASGQYAGVVAVTGGTGWLGPVWHPAWPDITHDDGDGSNNIYYGPPNSAYHGCGGTQNPGDCTGCCDIWSAAAISLIGAGAITICGATAFWGCLGALAGAAILAAGVFYLCGQCKKNCNIAYYDDPS